MYRSFLLSLMAVFATVSSYATGFEHDGEKKGTLKLSAGFAGNTMRQRGLDNISSNRTILSSEFHPTIQLGLDYRLRDHVGVFARFQRDNVEYEVHNSNILLEQEGNHLLNFETGFKFFLNDCIGLATYIGYQQDYVYYMTSATNGHMERYGHGLLGAELIYKIIRYRAFFLNGSTGLELYFPATVPGLFSTQMGMQINTEADLGFDFGRHVLAPFFRLEHSILQSDIWRDQYELKWTIGLRYSVNLYLL